MKKARIMLTIIAVLGITGGILAFKAQRYFTGSYYYAVALNGTVYCLQGASTFTTAGVLLVGFFKASTTGAYPIYPVALPVEYCTSRTTVYLDLGE